MLNTAERKRCKTVSISEYRSADEFHQPWEKKSSKQGSGKDRERQEMEALDEDGIVYWKTMNC